MRTADEFTQKSYFYKLIARKSADRKARRTRRGRNPRGETTSRRVDESRTH
jgi:hypothetical protein